MKVKVVFIEDHRLTIQSHELYYQNHAQVELLHCYMSGQEMKHHYPIVKNIVHVVVLDLNLNGNLSHDLIPWIKQQSPQAKVLVLSMYTDYQHISECMYLQADGYMIKKCGYIELTEAIIQVMEGKRYLHPEIIPQQVMKLLEKWTWIKKLKPTEITFLNYCHEGKTYAEMAKLMHKSERTVQNYRDELFKKFNVNNKISLLNEAKSFHLIG